MKLIIKKMLMICLLVGSLISQSGCIVGLATGNAPLAWVGLGGAWVAPNTGAPLLAYIGIVLNSEDTGRSNALNPLPLDENVAQALEVGLEDIETYNDELNEVIAADEAIVAVLQKGSENNSSSKEELNNAANLVGLNSSEELIDILKGDELSREVLNVFASSFEMSPKTAELYLKNRWLIKIEK
jgi:hypothetical protein